MGTLRVEPKYKKPGFTKFHLDEPIQKMEATNASHAQDAFDATIRLVTRQGTTLQISRDVPLKQVARLVRMLDGNLRL